MSSDTGDAGDDRSGDASAGGGNREVGVEGIAGEVGRTPDGEGEMHGHALIGQVGGEIDVSGSDDGESGSGDAIEEDGTFTDGEDDDGDDGSWEDEESGSDDDAALPAVPRDPERGCEHYGRGCKLFAPCCGEVHWCRFCHNAKWENCQDESKRHTLDRLGCFPPKSQTNLPPFCMSFASKHAQLVKSAYDVHTCHSFPRIECFCFPCALFQLHLISATLVCVRAAGMQSQRWCATSAS